VVTLILTSNVTCVYPRTAISNNVVLNVNPIQTPEVEIYTPALSIAQGETADFMAIVANAGDNPVYEWKVNGNIVGTNSPFYSTESLPKGSNTIYVKVTSSATFCMSQPTAQAQLSLTVDDNVTPSYIVGATTNPANAGTITGTGTYQPNEIVTISVSPNTNYVFKNITENGIVVSQSPIYTFTVSANKELVANFDLNGNLQLSVNTNAIALLSPTNSTSTFQLNSNTTWTITGNPSWCTVSPANGANNAIVTVTATSENTGVAPRTETLTISGLGVSNQLIIVTQASSGNGVKAYYPFNGNANDESGNGNNGTLVGATFTSDKFDNENSALSIAKKTDYMNVPDFNSDIISVSLWYYYNAPGNDWNTILCRDGGNYHHLLVDFNTNEIGFHNITFFSSGFKLTIGNWYHLVLVKDGINSKLYINGELKQDANNSFRNSDYPLSIIGNIGTPYFNQGALGKLDEIKIFNSKLTDSDIQYLYVENKIVTVSSLSIPANSGTIKGLGEYKYNSIVTLVATPSIGYRFVNWTENNTPVSTNTSYSFSITDNRILVANFELIPPQYYISAATIQGGKAEGTGSYEQYKLVTLTAIPDNGWEFDGWYENSIKVSTEAIYTFQATSNRTLIAVFKLKSSISNHSELNSVTIFPNPTTGITNITINLPQTTDIQLSVFDIHGRLVSKLFEGEGVAGENTFVWNSAPKAGVYIVKLTTPHGVVNQRVVVIE